LLATLFGIAIAFAVARLRFPGREVVDCDDDAADGHATDGARLLPLGPIGRSRGVIGAWLNDTPAFSLVFTLARARL